MSRYESKSVIYSALLRPKKNGHAVFNLDILEYCDKENIIIREQCYLDLLKPKYNILKIAGSSLGFKYSEATRAQMSLNNTGQKHPFVW